MGTACWWFGYWYWSLSTLISSGGHGKIPEKHTQKRSGRILKAYGGRYKIEQDKIKLQYRLGRAWHTTKWPHHSPNKTKITD
jgi:hypothetical protein